MAGLLECSSFYRHRPWLAVVHSRSAAFGCLTGQFTTTCTCISAAGRKPVALPGTDTQLRPSQHPYHAALLLCLFLALTYASVLYLSNQRRRQAEREQEMLTPESIIGHTPDVQQAWAADRRESTPQGDASSLPVDRSMQQPADVRHQDFKQEDVQDIFRSIHNLKQRLYGSNADVTIKGQRDLATAAAEIDRQAYN